MHAAYSLEIVVSPGLMRRAGQIIAAIPGQVDVHVTGPQRSGWAWAASAPRCFAVEERLRELREIPVIHDDQHGTAVTRLLLAAGAQDVTVWAPVGVLHQGLDEQLPEHKRWLAHHTNPRRIEGGLRGARASADAVVGVLAPGVPDRALIKRMARAPIVFALANPDPEIDPDDRRSCSGDRDRS